MQRWSVWFGLMTWACAQSECSAVGKKISEYAQALADLGQITAEGLTSRIKSQTKWSSHLRTQPSPQLPHLLLAAVLPGQAVPDSPACRQQSRIFNDTTFQGGIIYPLCEKRQGVKMELSMYW